MAFTNPKKRRMPTIQDTELRNRLDRLVVSTEDLASVIPEAAFQTAVELARQALRQASKTLVAAEAATVTNQARNAEASAKLAEARERVVDEYQWAYGRLRDALENVKPSARRELGEEKLREHKRLFATLFPTPPSGLERMRTADFKTRMEHIAVQLREHADAVPAEATTDLLAAVDALALAYSTLVKEGIDDGGVQAALETARGDGLRVERGMELAVEGLLLLSGSAVTLKDLVERRRSTAPTPATPPAPETPTAVEPTEPPTT